MPTQLLIYENVVPVNKVKHKDWSVKAGTGFGFARKMNSVPIVAVEFANAASEYAIVFAGEEEVVPVAILGMRQDENMYVAEDGSWKSKYVPAFIRRYPFVFSTTDEGKTFTLCIDEDFEGCNREGRGERLFDADSQQTQYLNGVLNFLQIYQAQFARTQQFCKKIKELGLLEPMQAQFTLSTGQQLALTGFMAVNREKLNALPGDKLSELARTGELELLYVHLHSMRNFSTMPGKDGTRPEETAEAQDSAVKPDKKKKPSALAEQALN